MRRLFIALFSGFRWARRLVGGKWELWWVDAPVCAEVWHDVEEWSSRTGRRPTCLCRGTPRCEEYA